MISEIADGASATVFLAGTRPPSRGPWTKRFRSAWPRPWPMSRRSNPTMPARRAHAVADACSSSRPSNAGASPAHRRMPPTRPGPPRHDPAWFTCIPPRSQCASGHNDARVDDAAPRADQHLTPSSKPESKPNPAPDGLPPAHRCPPGQLLHAPQTRAKTENPIGQHPRPATSCFGGYRTPAGARFPSQ